MTKRDTMTSREVREAAERQAMAAKQKPSRDDLPNPNGPRWTPRQDEGGQ